MSRHVPPARQARINAGLDVPTAAKRLRVAPKTLLQYERATPPLIFAERAAQLYGCRLEVFLTTPGGGRPNGGHGGGVRGKASSRLPIESRGDRIATSPSPRTEGEAR